MVSLRSLDLKNIRSMECACVPLDCSVLTLFCIRLTAVFCVSRLRISVSLLSRFAVCILSPSGLFPCVFRIPGCIGHLPFALVGLSWH